MEGQYIARKENGMLLLCYVYLTLVLEPIMDLGVTIIPQTEDFNFCVWLNITLLTSLRYNQNKQIYSNAEKRITS